LRRPAFRLRGTSRQPSASAASWDDACLEDPLHRARIDAELCCNLAHTRAVRLRESNPDLRLQLGGDGRTASRFLCAAGDRHRSHLKRLLGPGLQAHFDRDFEKEFSAIERRYGALKSSSQAKRDSLNIGNVLGTMPHKNGLIGKLRRSPAAARTAAL
jgi:hypothetical protein